MKILSKEGTILAVVILYMIVIVIWGLAFLQQAYLNKIVTGGCIRSNQAFWLAEAGIQDEVGRLTADPNSTIFPTDVPFGVGAGASHYTVLVTRADNLYTITSTGTVGNTTRTIVSQWRNSFFSGAASAGSTDPGSINLGGTKSGTDSYNSNVAAYDPANPGHNGDVQTNGSITGNGIIDGNISLGPNATSSVAVTGTVSYYTSPPMPPVTVPTLTSPEDIGPINGTDYTFTATKDYICGGISITNNKTVKVAPGVKVRMLLTGPINMNAGSELILESGASLIIYAQANIDITGNVNVAIGVPSNLQIYGTSACGSIRIGGTSQLYASIYAPDAILTMDGNNDLFGAFVGSKVNFNGPPMIHYDEALINWQPAPGMTFFTRTDWHEE